MSAKEAKAPGFFIKVYEKTSKEGKQDFYGRISRRRQTDAGWKDHPWINSLSDFDNIIEVCLKAKEEMRMRYTNRDANES